MSGFGTMGGLLPKGGREPGEGILAHLMRQLVERYVVPKLYRAVPVDLAADRTLKIETGQQQASLVYISVYSGTLDIYNGETSPSATSIPLTRVTPTGFPVPFALPPDSYTFTAHAANSAACRAMVILTSA